MTGTIPNYSEFWKHYLREHRSRRSRRLHFIGSTLALLFLAAALVLRQPWLIVGAVLSGYGFAWYGHFVYERNKPATFRYPLWSLVSDYRMYFLWLRGRLEVEFWRWQIR